MVRVHLNLKRGWFNLGIAEALTDHGRGDIANTDVAYETFSD